MASYFVYSSCFLAAFCGVMSHPPTSYSDDKSLQFMVLGDWGGIPINPYYTPDEVAVAKQMGIIAGSINASFVMALGDNFYENGVTDVDDKRFQDTFENVFTAKSLQVPWYVVAGNHDHYGNASAQVAYTSKSKRWNFPSLYYTQRYTIPGSNTSVVLVMIDTVTLCGNSYDTELMSIPPKGPDNPKYAEDQWAWIEKQLQNTLKEEYVIVAGHFPVWSIAEHGPTTCLVDKLKPLLEKYHVNAYFCGHDHNLQHLREHTSNVEYFVIGAAHVVDQSQKHNASVPKDSLLFYYAEKDKLGGFAYVQGSLDGLHFVFANGYDSIDIYHTVIKPRSFYWKQREDNSTVEYFVIGSANIVDPSTKHKDAIPPGSLRFYYAKLFTLGGFAYLTTTPDNMTLVFAQGFEGKDVYTYNIQPRSQQSIKDK